MFFKPLWIALSTYSVIPVPQFDWTEENLRYSICFFPLVGAVCGAALAGWYTLCTLLGASRFLFAAVAACIPLLISGGIHMDGYMDTVDALASHQPRDKKLAILKDPHCGAFAVSYCAVYLLLFLGLMYELFQPRLLPVLCPGFILSRALSALCALCLPNARKGGMLDAYTHTVHKKRAAFAMAFVALLAWGAMVFLCPLPGLLAGTAAVLWALAYRRMTLRQFGGVTGDTAGFFLQVCELFILAGVWLGGLAV